ncbi:MAG: 2-oxo-4-hydroxy-4-carboxy-5-ureidoimidazoline decarboxylase [Pseudomonadota bacterium]
MASAPHTLQAVNAMTVAEFVAVFGNIAEHAPWVADRAAADRPFASRDAMVGSFRSAIDNADRSAQHALLCAHPDLAGKAAIAGDLTKASKSEQAGAGLDRLTPDEFDRFTDFNRRYRERFGFPFILAVKGADKATILEAFGARIDNAVETEFQTALLQVGRIVRFRLEDNVAP